MDALLYPGDSSLTDGKTILGIVLNSGLVILTFIETLRAQAHVKNPYGSVVDISGIGRVNNITGVELDALAMLMYQYGFAGLVEVATFLVPFLFGD